MVRVSTGNKTRMILLSEKTAVKGSVGALFVGGGGHAKPPSAKHVRVKGGYCIPRISAGHPKTQSHSLSWLVTKIIKPYAFLVIAFI